MNFIHLISDKVWGARPRFVYDLARALRADSHESVIAVPSSPQIIRRFTEASFDVRRLPMGQLFDFVSVISLANVIRHTSGNTIVHAHTLKDMVIATRAADASARADVKVIATIHQADSPCPDTPSWRKILQRVDAVTFPSARAMSAFLPHPAPYRHKLSVLRHATLDTTDIHHIAEQNTPSPTPVIMWMGAITPDKGLDTIFKATELLKSTGRRFTLRITGEGNARTVMPLKQTCRRLEIDDIVTWTGYTDNTAPLVSTAQVAVFAPCHECHSSQACEEFIAAGVPVVAPDQGIFADMSEANRIMLYEAGDAESLADTLSRAIDHPVAPLRDYTYAQFYTSYTSLCRSLFTASNL